MIRFGLCTLGIVVISSIFFVSPASADRMLTTHIVAQPTAPVAVNYCEAREGDGSGGNGEDYLYLGFDSTALTKPVTAVRIKFTLTNTFGEDLSPTLPVLATAIGTFSVGEKVSSAGSNATKLVNIWGDNIDLVTCSADTVKFADGSIWTASAPVPSPSASP
jgi:hypothetical protein